MSGPGPAPRRPGVAGLVLGALLGVAVLLLIGEGMRERRVSRDAWPLEDGTALLPGLAAEVEVLRDERGIPHVTAKSEADALRALGFLHAQDRLAQMVWLARSARGRAAEWVGEQALDADRMARLLGIGALADAQVKHLPRSTRRALEAYAEGVNARIARIQSGAVAPPRALRDAELPLEPWTPADSLAVLKLYAWSLGSHVAESLVLEDLIERLGSRDARAPFFPRGAGIRAGPPEREARLVPPPPAAELAPLALAAGAPGDLPGGDPLRRALGLDGPGTGSSAWIVGGALAAEGGPLLAADQHLVAETPPLLYEAQLRAPDLDVAGATLPGLPVFWLGRNPRLAWGVANPAASILDLYIELLDPDDPSRYFDGTGFRPLAVRRESIAVRGRREPEVLEVRSTPHGPLLNPLLDGDREPLALDWTGARQGDGIGSFLALARARSAEEARAALADHHEPVFAVVFADADGQGGLQVAGWLPRRQLPSGLVPVHGRNPSAAWRGRVPFAELPSAVLKPDGWLIAADNLLAPAGDESVEWLWRSGVRAGRIEELLTARVAKGPLDLQGLAAMQRDVRSSRARALVDACLRLAGPEAELDSESRQAAALLQSWDGSLRVDRVGATLYHVLLEQLARNLFEDALGEPLYERWRKLERSQTADAVGRIVVAAAAGGGAFPGWDDPEQVATAVRQALRASWLWLSVREGPNREKWVWGRLHPLRFTSVPPLDGLLRPSSAFGPFPYPGDGSSIAAGAYVPGGDDFAARVVSLYRLAVDTRERGHALSSLAPGQSEHPGNPQRASGLPRWLQGRPQLLLSGLLLVEENERARLVLEPAP